MTPQLFLATALDSKMPIGFSPWEDNLGCLWGYVVEFGDTYFVIDDLNVNGQITERKTFDISDVSSFQDDPIYSERLVQLGKVAAILPKVVKLLRKGKKVKLALLEAVATGEIVRVKLGKSYKSSIQVNCVQDDWFEFTTFDDLMRPLPGRNLNRISRVTSLEWRSRMLEGETFLLHLEKGKVQTK